MIVRIATFATAPTDNRDWVIDALKGVPGVRSAYHVLDQQSGALYSISVYDGEEGERAGLAAISARAQEIGHQGFPPDDIKMCDVIRFVENR